MFISYQTNLLIDQFHPLQALDLIKHYDNKYVEYDLKADAEELKHEAENVPLYFQKPCFMALLAPV